MHFRDAVLLDYFVEAQRSYSRNRLAALHSQAMAARPGAARGRRRRSAACLRRAGAGATATIFFMHGKLYGRAVATVAWRRTRITPDTDALIKKSPTFRALEGRRGGGPE